MSKRFLTPVNLPSGPTLPVAGSIGDLFFRTTDQSLYAYTSSGWLSNSASTTVSSLNDVQLTSVTDGHVLVYSSALGKWINLNLADILNELGAITSEGGDPSTTQFTATIEGGSPNTTVFVSTFDGGNESSF